jgi:aspartate-semialdehyde dehydrogenase
MPAIHEVPARSDQSWRELLVTKAYCAGRWIDADARIEVFNPANGEVIGTVPSLSAAHVQEAIATAKAVQADWRARLPRERGDLLMSWRALILENREGLAALMTAEQGKPISEALGEIEYGAEFIRWFAEEASRIYGDVIPSHLPNRKMLVQREPLGVVALITPWNFPNAMLTRKAAAALAAGCTVVATQSRETPFSALALALLAERAGLPPGVFSVLTGSSREIVGELCANPLVRGVSFTGSTEVGRIIAAQSAPTIKRLALELGGHAPVLVFADADIEAAAATAVAAKFQTTGQDCLAANRIYVERPIYQDFVRAFAQRAKALKVADGFTPGAEIGPLINASAFHKARAHVDDALSKGASLAAGGLPHSAGDLFFQPTVLADVTDAMDIVHEETFGPVAAIMPFDSEADVLRAANNTEYGLIAYVFTRDLSRAHRVSDALEYGMIAVNTAKITGAPIPFGGVKQSGMGREGSRYGVAEFTDLKYVCLAI